MTPRRERAPRRAERKIDAAGGARTRPTVGRRAAKRNTNTALVVLLTVLLVGQVAAGAWAQEREPQDASSTALEPPLHDDDARFSTIEGAELTDGTNITDLYVLDNSSDPILLQAGFGPLDPWVDSTGDVMTGDLDMGSNSILLGSDELASPSPGILQYAGHDLCLNTGNCELGGDITAVMAETGLLGGGMSGDVALQVDTSFMQRRVSASCPAGGSIRAIADDGAVTCETDTDTLGTLACALDQYASWSGSAWTCTDPSPIAWLLGGNAATTPGTHFLGTTDPTPFEIHVDANRALRIEPGTTPNLIGGHPLNSVTPGVVGTTISGGGSEARPNKATGGYATLGGGENNTAAANHSSVGGGHSNLASETFATVGGGFDNQATGYASFVGAGQRNEAGCCSTVVGGGESNAATANWAFVGGGLSNRAAGEKATVAGGEGNTASALQSTVAGGFANTASAERATIGGGYRNMASGWLGTIGGGESNTASGWKSTIGGGFSNAATNQLSTIGGGSLNNANGLITTVAGGGRNTAQGRSSAVGGGEVNTASADYSTVSGGEVNMASAEHSTVSGGESNKAELGYATVGGGIRNTASEYASTVGGGQDNTASGMLSSIGGGISNLASGQWSTVGGGETNTASGQHGTIAGGARNIAQGVTSAVGGGLSNEASGENSVIAGGFENSATGFASFVGAGQHNAAGCCSAVVGGGEANSATASWAIVGGGLSNTASGLKATVAGGDANTASGEWSTVPGGVDNTAQGLYSFAAGRHAKALHHGTFVWADGTDVDVATIRNNEAVFQTQGGFRIFTNGAQTTGVSLAPGSGSWASMSDASVKDDVEPVDPATVLDGVRGLDISTWRYGSQQADIHHMGPMAQDFYAAFGLGEGDTTINVVDADGVALVAIQGLDELVHEQRSEIAELHARLAYLEQLVATLVGE